jgi:hypothetical protein
VNVVAACTQKLVAKTWRKYNKTVRKLRFAPAVKWKAGSEVWIRIPFIDWNWHKFGIEFKQDISPKVEDLMRLLYNIMSIGKYIKEPFIHTDDSDHRKF